MRNLAIVASPAALLAGCGVSVSKQEVVRQLGSEYVGKNIDVLVAQFGPPATSFKMNSGETAYQWQLSSVRTVDRDRGVAATKYCKINVVAAQGGAITQLHTEDSDSSDGLQGLQGFDSMCATRLGIARHS